MRKLQNNFTTLEQSERLLELGVPADSADMYIECYWCDGHNGMWRYKIGSHEIFRDRKQIGEGVGAIRPCWSVGRLIEIYLICNEVIDNVTELHHSAIKIDVREFNTVEYIICKLTNKIKKNKDFLSKLEE